MNSRTSVISLICLVISCLSPTNNSSQSNEYSATVSEHSVSIYDTTILRDSNATSPHVPNTNFGYFCDDSIGFYDGLPQKKANVEINSYSKFNKLLFTNKTLNYLGFTYNYTIIDSIIQLKNTQRTALNLNCSFVNDSVIIDMIHIQSSKLNAYYINSSLSLDGIMANRIAYHHQIDTCEKYNPNESTDCKNKVFIIPEILHDTINYTFYKFKFYVPEIKK